MIGTVPVYNAEDYGMIPNSMPDAAANATALQNAINDCAAGSGGLVGGVVLIPSNTYYIAGLVTVPNVAGIAIAGQTQQVSLNQTLLTSPTFDIKNTHGTRFDYLSVTYPNTSTQTQGVFHMNGVRNIQFNNVRTNGAAVGWYMFGCSDITLNACGCAHDTNNIAAVWVDGGGSTNPNGSIGTYFHNCAFAGNSVGAAILLGWVSTLDFVSCKFETFKYGFDIGNGSVWSNADRVGGGAITTEEINLLDCRFNTQMVSYGFYVHPRMNWTVQDIRIADTHFQCGDSALFFTKDTASFGAISGVVIDGSIADFSTTGSGLHIQAGDTYTITGGFFGANQRAGVFLDASVESVSDVIMTGVNCEGSLNGGGAQLYGLELSGALSNINVVGCSFAHNTTPVNLVAGFAGTKLSVVDCLGYNDLLNNLTTAFTPTSGTAFGPEDFGWVGPTTVFVSGGTITGHISVLTGGTEVSTGLTSGIFPLSAVQKMKVSWSAVPSFLVIGM